MKLSQFSEVSQVKTASEHTVVFIGTALDGPAHAPFILNPKEDVYEALGQSPLADAYHAAARAGVNNIVLYRLNGKHAEAHIKTPAGEDVLSFRSVSAASYNNDIQMTLYPTHLYLRDAAGKTRSYFFEEYTTSSALEYAINRDAFYGLVEFYAHAVKVDYPLENLVTTPTETMFSGGEDESHLLHSRDPQSAAPTDEGTITPILKERLGNALFGENPDDISDRQPNSHLGALNTGVYALCDMFPDDDVEFAEMLGSFCLNKTKHSGIGAIGVLGVQPIFPEVVDEGEDQSFQQTVAARSSEWVAAREALADQEGHKYVQVVTGHTVYTASDNPSIPVAYAYAATQAQLPYHTMMSNKSLTGFGKLTFELRKEDIALLTANGYICIVPSVRRGFVPYSVASFSKERQSALAKPHNLRISQYVSRGVTEEMDRLIGEGYSELSLNLALERVNVFLMDLVTAGVTKDYDFESELSERNTVLSLSIALTPVTEVKAIQSIVTIDFPRGVIA